MPTCPRCKTVLADDVRFCPVDGTPINPPEADNPALAASLPTAAAIPGLGPQPQPPAGKSDEPSLIGTIIDNRYRITAPLGEGGIGAVYQAEHIQIRRKVAVKVLHPEMAANPEFQARFEREALAASKVTHPSCVQVLDFGTYAKRAYLVMELVQGEVLREQLQKGPLPLEEAVDITDQLLSALSQIHSNGIVHRDLKPANIMLCEPDQTGVRVKLLDFGLAKNLQPGEPGGSPLTQYGTVFGTPGYISPEQATATPADARSDIYSVGVILFEMVCGRTPFVSDDPVELIQAHISLPPPNPRRLRKEISPALEAVISRALAKSRKERFQTAEEFAAALAQVPEARPNAQETSVPRAAPASSSSVLPAPIGGRGLWGRPKLLLALIVGVALVVGLFFVFSSNDQADGPQKKLATAKRKAPQKRRHHHKARPRRSSPPQEERPKEPPAPAAEATPAPANETAQASSPQLSRDVRRAANYLGRGWTEAAIKQARRAVHKKHKDPYAHLYLGHAYYKRLWCSDAIKEYRKALSLAPQLKSDSTLIAHTIGCLGRRSTSGKAGYLLVHTIGEPARPLLEEAAQKHGSTEIRRRAAWLLKRLDGDNG